MRRESPFPMVPVSDARALIAAHARPLPAEEVDALVAIGRVLAEPVYAPEPMPPSPRALVDGYALRAADGQAPRRVLAELVAGEATGVELTAGTAVRIMTGAPLPPGADTVVMVERTHEQGAILTVERAPHSGEHVRQPGQDLPAGELVLAAGTTLGPSEIALLATIGCTRVQATRRPRVAVLSTGDEVREPWEPQSDATVRDSNRYALLAAIHEAGCEPLALGIVRDNPDAIRAALQAGLQSADVLVTSGGVSMGTRDLIKPLLAELGTVHFGRVFFKPGKPTTFATVGPKLVFGLPGFPVSALVSFEVFVRPALRQLLGAARPDRPVLPVTLASAIEPSDRVEYHRAQVRWQDGRLLAFSTGLQWSSRVLSLRDANALLIVPPGGATLAVGTLVDALLTGPILV